MPYVVLYKTGKQRRHKKFSVHNPVIVRENIPAALEMIIRSNGHVPRPPALKQLEGGRKIGAAMGCDYYAYRKHLE